MTNYLTNAFSPTMLPREETTVIFVPVSLGYARYVAQGDFVSGVGHADTAALFSALLDADVPANRISIKLVPGDDTLVVGQYSGPRLPEGCTILPEGAEIVWWSVLPVDFRD
jgi:hypothetical protein